MRTLCGLPRNSHRTPTAGSGSVAVLQSYRTHDVMQCVIPVHVNVINVPAAGISGTWTTFQGNKPLEKTPPLRPPRSQEGGSLEIRGACMLDVWPPSITSSNHWTCAMHSNSHSNSHSHAARLAPALSPNHGTPPGHHHPAASHHGTPCSCSACTTSHHTVVHAPHGSASWHTGFVCAVVHAQQLNHALAVPPPCTRTRQSHDDRSLAVVPHRSAQHRDGVAQPPVVSDPPAGHGCLTVRGGVCRWLSRRCKRRLRGTLPASSSRGRSPCMASATATPRLASRGTCRRTPSPRRSTPSCPSSGAGQSAGKVRRHLRGLAATGACKSDASSTGLSNHLAMV